MKIEFYLANDEDGKLIKEFLEQNNLPFKTIKEEIKSWSSLKTTYSHSIHIIEGYNKLLLNQLIEHINKYKPKIEKNFKVS